MVSTRAGIFGFRFGANSKAIFRFSSSTRKAAKGRPNIVMNCVSRSVRPSEASFLSCSRLIAWCKMALLTLNRHGVLSACDFSHK